MTMYSTASRTSAAMRVFFSVLVAFFLVAAPTIALAAGESSSGGGDSIDGVGNTASGKHWVMVAGDKTRTAWEKLVGNGTDFGVARNQHAFGGKKSAAQARNWAEGIVQSISNKAGPSWKVTEDANGKVTKTKVPLISLCRESDYIWVLQATSGKAGFIAYDNKQITWPTWNGKNPLTDYTQVKGSNLPSDDDQARYVIKYTTEYNSRRPSPKVLVCSGNISSLESCHGEGANKGKKFPMGSPQCDAPKSPECAGVGKHAGKMFPVGSSECLPPPPPPNCNGVGSFAGQTFPPGDARCSDTPTGAPPVGECGSRPAYKVPVFKNGKWIDDYSWTVTVTPQIVSGGIDPIGKPNLHEQMGSPKITNYGTVLNEANGTKLMINQMDAKVNAALAKDKTLARATINLDAANKEGMAEGGVLNVNETTRPGEINVEEQWWQYWVPVCNWHYYISGYTTDSDGNSVPIWSRYEVWTDVLWKTPLEDVINSGWQVGQFNSAFWQILSVHCNPDEYAAAVAAAPEAESEGQADDKLASVAYSKTYVANTSKSGRIKTYGPAPAQPAVLDFGDASNGNSALRRTSQLGFYDKECPFECVSSSSAIGASGANGATENINNGSPAGNKPVVRKFGAVSGMLNDNKFEFFRDNVDHEIKVDVAYPSSGDGVEYDGHAPLTTTITRWVKGTPDVNTATGGKFTMTTESGEEVFTSPGTPKNQRNWSPKPGGPASESTFKTSTSTQLEGLHRTFNVKATWASENNRPQIFNVRWEYAPDVNTTFAMNGIGFDTEANGKEKVYFAGDEAAPIQGKCFANFGTESSADTFDEKVQKFTGTGTTNGIDGVLVEGEPSPPVDARTNLFVKFLRATSE